MNGIIHFETFLITGLLLNLTPGNDTIFILSRSIAQGRKAGLISVLGISTGLLVHTMLAAFGLSIIIAKSILLFNIVKYAGAAYLIYIGLKMLGEKSRLNVDISGTLPKQNLLTIYRDGVITNILNPKVALFFIAFLPQFIEPGYKTSFIPFFKLGIVFTTTATIWTIIVSYFSAAIFSRLRRNPNFAAYLNKSCGAVLIVFGVKVAFTGRQ